MKLVWWRLTVVGALFVLGAAAAAALADLAGLPRPVLLLFVGGGVATSGFVVFTVVLAFALQRAGNRFDTTPKVRGMDRWAAIWRECRRMMVCMLWWHPLRSEAHADFLPADGSAQGRRGVVLVHGFFCNRGFWNQWMPRLRAAGVPFAAVNLLPTFGRIDDYPPIIDAAVRRVVDATGLAPVIVGHSMGGLATRAWLREQCAARPGRLPDDEGGDPAVAHVVTLGTPHRGTAMAEWALSPNARQMKLGSPWLASNEAAIEHLRGLFTCFYSDADQIVVPAQSATLDGADNRLLPASGHMNLAWREEPWAFVQTLLQPH